MRTTTKKPRSPRVHVYSPPDVIELMWISKRGRTEINVGALGALGNHRYLIQRVAASSRGSYWNTVEVCASEQYAFDRARSLSMTERRSYRVSRQKTAAERNS